MKILADRKIPFPLARLSTPARMLFLIVTAALFCGLSLLFYEAGAVYLRTGKTLEKLRRDRSNEPAIEFSRVFLAPHHDPRVSFRQNPKNVRDLAPFGESFYAATGAGLLRLDRGGRIVKHYTVLDGLPESDLTALAVFRSRLYVGTRSKGLISFDGENFEQYRLRDHETKSITVLLATPQALLAGTFAGGLLEFDGNAFAEIRAAGGRIGHVTFLLADGARLVVGTFDEGLRIRQGGVWLHLSTADGLLSNRVVGAAIAGEKLIAATDLGVSQAYLAEIKPGAVDIFRQNAVLPALSSLILRDGRIHLTRDNGELFSFPADLKLLETGRPQKIERSPAPKTTGARLRATADAVWLLSNQGIEKTRGNGGGEFAFAAFAEFNDANYLTEETVSALVIDRQQRLWAGTFRHGIDVFSLDGVKLRHLAGETVREINLLVSDAESGTIFAATSVGLVRFDAAFGATPEPASPAGRAVAGLARYGSGKEKIVALAGPKGLLIRGAGPERLLTNVNGLPGNSINAVLFDGQSLWAGTLGGLARIDGGKVSRVYKTSNSELKNNWITALCAAGERIFAGTYGGGIYELLPSGEIRSFAAETGGLFVNPNAMYADRDRLYAGTLGGVWSLD
jgi:hypothetical protein